MKSQTGKSGFMKVEKCVAARLTQCCTGEMYRSQSQHPPFMLPTHLIAHLLTSGHEFICFHHLWFCAYTVHVHCRRSVCHMATVYKQSQSPVTGHRSYSSLFFRCTPSECPVSMWKSASQGHRVTFLQLFGILPQGSSSVEVCACACVFVWRACMDCLSYMPQTAFC